MQEEPLHLIPRPLRREFEKMLDAPIEGDLCPICRFRVEEEHGGRYEDVPVTTVGFSKQSRRGAAIVPPVDPHNPDNPILTASADIPKPERLADGAPPPPAT